MPVLLAEQRIRMSGPRLWEAGSLPAEDAEWVPTSHCNAAPKPPRWLHTAVWCPVYPSAKGQTVVRVMVVEDRGGRYQKGHLLGYLSS